MSTLILHIGSKKTGSTALQGLLQCNKKVLAQAGYVFPIFEKPKSQAHLLRNGAHLSSRFVLGTGEVEPYEQPLEPGETVLTPEEARELVERYTEGNSYLAERFLGSEQLFSDDFDRPVWQADEQVLREVMEKLEAKLREDGQTRKRVFPLTREAFSRLRWRAPWTR